MQSVIYAVCLIGIYRTIAETTAPSYNDRDAYDYKTLISRHF